MQISAEALAKHDSEYSCWVALHGKVYDLTGFLQEHPGGKRVILQCAGKDGTSAFSEIHSVDVIARSLPRHCEIGMYSNPVNTAVKKDPFAVVRRDLPSIDRVLNVFDMEALAQTCMTEEGWAYYAAGAEDEVTLRENHSAFARIWLRPRVLVDVAEISLGSRILGHASSLPLYITATALGKLAHPDGEVAISRAAAACNAIYMLPSLASCSFEQMSSARLPSQTHFFQLYVNPNRAVMRQMIAQAKLAGCKACCVTVDAPQMGRRERDMRFKFKSEINRYKDKKVNRSQGTANALSSFIDPSLTWKDIHEIQALCGTDMPVVVKGIQTGEDAVLAAEHGVKAIILSNHGGRQLDYARSAIEILPEVMAALREHKLHEAMEVWIDGGIRRGTDIFKALALGATCVGVGRPILHGLAAYGQQGVEKVLDMFRTELEGTMRNMVCVCVCVCVCEGVHVCNVHALN
jgi:L-lactate dehydrogenase (cytochrome)